MSGPLVFGRTGQVARELKHLASGQALELLALGRDAADLAQPGACAAAIHTHRPSAVINAAAYTAVDRAEMDEPLATAINGAAPAEMALACSALKIPLVHISSDYVFAGTCHQPWAPGDIALPANAYGRSKWVGEEGIRAELGWRPSVTVEEGLERTVRWYLENEGWWRPLLGRQGVGQRLGRAAP